jgi:hypothetical protein
MNTIIKSNENSIIEFAKRSISSFYLLIIGLAIPLLFLVGISNINQKKVEEKEVKEISNSAQFAKPIVGLYIPKI